MLKVASFLLIFHLFLIAIVPITELLKFIVGELRPYLAICDLVLVLYLDDDSLTI